MQDQELRFSEPSSLIADHAYDNQVPCGRPPPQAFYGLRAEYICG